MPEDKSILQFQRYSVRRPFRGSFLRTRMLAAFALLLLLPNLFAQTSAITSAMAPMALYINILEGEDALNNIRDRTAREPIVQITDENHKPVKGAVVTFSEVAGATGAAATFGGLATYTTVSDAEGKAVGRGFRPNSITGDHRVQVAAAVGMLVAAMIFIHEKNVTEGAIAPPPKGGLGAGSGSSAWFIGGLTAAVSAVAIYLGVSSDSDTPASLGSTTPVTPTSPVPVPEIDASLAFGCLALLAGAAEVMRRR